MTGNKTATTCAVGERDGKVVLQFPEAVQWAAFDPETARQIGLAIAKAAYKAHTGSDATTGSIVISETLRERMILNITHMIRSLEQKKHKPRYIAMNVVDAILQEVT
jgi:hypothetical protein